MNEMVIPEYRVSTDRLRIGVFIRLEGLQWYEHPFLFKNFKIANMNQLRTLQSLAVKEVICVPSKSDVLPLDEDVTKVLKNDDAEIKSAAEELWRIKKERAERLRLRQEKIAQCEKNYVSSQENIAKIMTGITAGDPASVEAAGEFADQFSAYFLEDIQATLHLMRLDAKDEGIYYHSMNVTVLAMTLGRALGVNADDMKALCQGALFPRHRQEQDRSQSPH